MTPVAAAATRITAVSDTLDLAGGCCGADHNMMTGAMSRVPAASASHHVAQTPAEWVKEKSVKLESLAAIWPARIWPIMAIAELIAAVGTNEMSANLAMPGAVANVS